MRKYRARWWAGPDLTQWKVDVAVGNYFGPFFCWSTTWGADPLKTRKPGDARSQMSMVNIESTPERRSKARWN